MDKVEGDKYLSRYVAKSPSCEIWFNIVVDDKFSKLEQILSEKLSHNNKVFTMVKETFHFNDVVFVAFSCLPQ